MFAIRDTKNKNLDFGRLGAEERLAEIDRRGRRIKIGLLTAYCVGAVTFIARDWPIVATFDKYVEKKLTSKTSAKLVASMDERPFDGLRVRHYGTQKKRSDDNWFIWGVSRFDAPTFYLNVWAGRTSKLFAHDIRNKLMDYRTLVSCGTFV